MTEACTVTESAMYKGVYHGSILYETHKTRPHNETLQLAELFTHMSGFQAGLREKAKKSAGVRR